MLRHCHPAKNANTMKRLLGEVGIGEVREEAGEEAGETASGSVLVLGQESELLREQSSSRLKAILRDYGYNMKSSSQVRSLISESASQDPGSAQDTPLGAEGTTSPTPPSKRIRWEASLNDSGVVADGGEKVVNSPKESALCTGRLDSSQNVWGECLKEWMKDKVWMKEEEVKNISDAFGILRNLLKCTGKWESALELMDEEVRVTVNALLEKTDKGGE